MLQAILWVPKAGTISSMGTNRENEEAVTPIAVTNWRDIRRKFGIRQKNRRGHIYILGKTGTGKSTLIGNMMISDMQAGYGVALIDPHGDLAETMLRHVPKARVEDVIFFDPSDLEHPVAFNPLECDSKDKRHLVASGLISTFKKLWPEFWGPRMEHILRHALLTLLEVPGTTLLDLPKLLLDDVYRKQFVGLCTNQAVSEFWFNEFDNYSAYFRSEAVSPILNKVGQFLVNAPVRQVVCHPKSSFDLRQVMDESKILIANLAKGRIGEDSSSLLGAMLVTHIQLAALSRANSPQHSRKSFYLYVDEVQNYLTGSYADVLSESRKFGLSLTMSHQYLAQLDDEVRSAILGNVGTVIAFRVGNEDARVIAKEFAPVVREQDLIVLPNHHMYLKLMIDGVTSPPFTATTWAVPEPESDQTQAVIEASRHKYAVRRETATAACSKANKRNKEDGDQLRLF